MPTLAEFGVLIGFPVLRSVSGWLNNALEDGKIDIIEWRQLASTVIRVGSLGLVAFLGLQAAGVDYAAIIGGSLAYVADMVFRKLHHKLSS